MSRVYKRGEFYYVDVKRNGRRFRKRIGKTKRLAETVLKEMDVQIERDQWGFGKQEGDIRKVIESFMLNAKLHVRDSTRMRYAGIIDNFLTFLDSKYPSLKRVIDLSPAVIQEYKLHRAANRVLSRKHTSIGPIKRNGNLHPKTMNLELKTIKSVFKFGVETGLCGSNPFANVKLLKFDKRKVPKFLSTEECQRFLNCCPAEFRPIFVTLINTGMRSGEMSNLQWKDVDFDNGHIKIRAKEFWEPKSGERIIPLNSVLANEFMKLKGKVSEKDLVFRRGNDENFGRRLRRLAGKVAKEADIETHVNIHTFRHSFASQLVMAGVDLPTVQTLLGHSDIQTTMIYSHLASSHLKNALKVMDGLYGPVSSKIEHVTNVTRLENNKFDVNNATG